jgi:hypothetical protein
MSAKSSSPTRRGFLSTSAAGAVTLAAAQLATIGSTDAQPGKTKRADLPKIKPGANTSFASLKQIEAGLLNVGYAEAGPADGPADRALFGQGIGQVIKVKKPLYLQLVKSKTGR